VLENTENQYCYKYPHPSVTTDTVVFTIFEEILRLLLIKRGAAPYLGSWAIPGGFLEMDEDLDDCARRELKEETGVEKIHMEQLYTFGTPGRDPRERVISVAYFAITPYENIKPVAASDASDVEWFPLNDLPTLAFDHDKIINIAHNRLKLSLGYSALAFKFLPETFTLSEAQRIYEIVSNKKLDKRNFRKSITNSGFIEETGNTRCDGNHRPARLYRIAIDKQTHSINS
jgi:8-oxo-dGTP diphosphatase